MMRSLYDCISNQFVDVDPSDPLLIRVGKAESVERFPHIFVGPVGQEFVLWCDERNIRLAAILDGVFTPGGDFSKDWGLLFEDSQSAMLFRLSWL